MSHWATFLLATFVVLGLSPATTPKAVRLAVVLTALVVSTIMVKTVVLG
jgi:hypothetical protein